MNDVTKTAKMFNQHNHETTQYREHRSFVLGLKENNVKIFNCNSLTFFLSAGRDVSDDIQLIMNNRGRTAIYHEQHKFIKQNENQNVSHYRCTEYKVAKCRARIAYDAETGNAQLLRQHNHEPNLENRRYHLKDIAKVEDIKKESDAEDTELNVQFQ